MAPTKKVRFAPEVVDNEPPPEDVDVPAGFLPISSNSSSSGNGSSGSGSKPRLPRSLEEETELAQSFRRRRDAVFASLGEPDATMHSRAAAVADNNERAEEEHERHEPIERLEVPFDAATLQDAVDAEWDDAQKRKIVAGRRSHQQHQQQHPHQRQQAFVRNPDKWTKYTLEDSLPDARAEKLSALAFLKELQERKQAERLARGEALDSVMTPRAGHEAVVGRRMQSSRAAAHRRGATHASTSKVGSWRAFMDEDAAVPSQPVGNDHNNNDNDDDDAMDM